MYTETQTDEQQGLDTELPGTNEALLRSEIGFWREMIDSHCTEQHPVEALDRMRHALALAEFRLSILFRQHQDARDCSGKASGNVFYLKGKNH